MVTFRPDTSFPFLAIATKRGVPYGVVIRQAEAWWRSFEIPEVMPPGINSLSIEERDCALAVDCDIIEAVVAERRRRATVAFHTMHTGDAP